MSHDQQNHDEHAHLAGPEARKRIWIVFTVLSLITIAEFIIAFQMPRNGARSAIFIIMTLAKAAGIVAYFMHMKDEVRSLMLAVLLPTLFLGWFIYAMLNEGTWYVNGWFDFLTK